jgi:folate-binding protein YgfZ
VNAAVNAPATGGAAGGVRINLINAPGSATGTEGSEGGRRCATEAAEAAKFPPVLRGFPRVAAARLGEEGWDVRVPLERLDEVKLALGGLLASQSEWEALRIRRGIPLWGAELDENTLPPEAGLERTHIDYHKGCYIGQEVISRLKSVGHVNRSLCRLLGSGPERPSPGAVFFTESGAEAGVLTSVAGSGPGDFSALGYVKRAHAQETSFRCGNTVLKTVAAGG